MLHVYPLNDERPHLLEGTGCPCGPSVEWRHPDTGEAHPEGIVVHRAWDCREAAEEAEAILAAGEVCPHCGMSLQTTAEGDSTMGEGFDLFCPACHSLF
jgi:uncharacterized protein YbaR (Trm112 family)